MRGHEPLIAMRKAGKSPKMVFLNDFACEESRDWQNPGEKFGQTWAPDHATVSTDGDSLASIDLRFLVGLTVSISSASETRAKALFEKAKKSGAKTVAACHFVKHSNRIESKWDEVYHAPELVNA